MSRGIRNNNPGNIKDFGIPWEGLAADHERTPEQQKESTFCVFRGPHWGIRAMAIILRNYQKKHNLRTINQMMNRWAPKSDSNPIYQYTNYVAEKVGVGQNVSIDVDDFDTMLKLVRAITRFENGEDPYDCEYHTGLILAGIEPRT